MSLVLEKNDNYIFNNGEGYIDNYTKFRVSELWFGGSQSQFAILAMNRTCRKRDFRSPVLVKSPISHIRSKFQKLESISRLNKNIIYKVVCFYSVNVVENMLENALRLPILSYM